MKKYLLLLLSVVGMIAFVSLNAHPDLIKSLKIINKNKIVVKANRSFSRRFTKEDFFAEYDASVDLAKLDKSVVTIPFILSVIPIIWIFNKNFNIGKKYTPANQSSFSKGEKGKEGCEIGIRQRSDNGKGQGGKNGE